MSPRGYCLVSQELDALVSQGMIQISKSLQHPAQPSSYEPVLGDEIFVLDTETSGIFRPTPDKTVYRALLELPKRQRQKASLSAGFEAKKDILISFI